MITVAPGTVSVTGCVVIQGDAASTVTSNVTRLRTDKSIDIPNSMLSLGDIPSGFVPAQGAFLEFDFTWTNALPAPVAIGADGFIKLFNFEVAFLGTCPEGSCIELNYVSSVEAVQAGVSVGGQNYDFVSGSASSNAILIGSDISPGAKINVGAGGPTPTDTQMVEPPTPTNTTITGPLFTPTFTTIPPITSTPTQTETPFTPTATGTATNTQIIVVTATPTPSEITVSGCDAGLYLLLSSGGLQPVGNPPNITSSLSLGDLAIDLERALSQLKTTVDDLVVLDGSGILHFVQGGGSIAQDFMFTTSTEFPIGRATDFQLTRDSQGAWVLTDFGGIYRAGTAKEPADPALVPGTDQMGVYGYDVGFGAMRNSGVADPGGASLRAVALQVIDLRPADNRADGYLVIDTQGGHRQINPDGTDVASGTWNSLSANDPNRLLEPAPNGYAFPFFPGLDIARDVDLLTTSGDKGLDLGGVVILDGWGGIHPVPVNDPANPVFFSRNEDPNNPGTPITTVGMPYLVVGFDDPDTVGVDESDPANFGIDAFSIFKDLDFSLGCPDGFYTMDKFGSVFAFGSTRSVPGSLAPLFVPPPPFRAAQDVVNMQLFPNETIFSR